MAKLIVTGATREQALARARRALQEFTIEGVASVLPFHRAVVRDAAFTAQDGFGVHTRWIETEMATRFDSAARPEAEGEGALLRTYLEIDGKRVRLGLPAGLGLQLGGASAPATAAQAPAATAPGDVLAPLTGSLVAWHKHSGDLVQAGEVIAVVEAMKMESAVAAPQAGRLECLATVGGMLNAGQCMARVVAVA